MNKSLRKTMKLDQMFWRQMCEYFLFVLGRNLFLNDISKQMSSPFLCLSLVLCLTDGSFRNLDWRHIKLSNRLKNITSTQYLIQQTSCRPQTTEMCRHIFFVTISIFFSSIIKYIAVVRKLCAHVTTYIHFGDLL